MVCSATPFTQLRPLSVVVRQLAFSLWIVSVVVGTCSLGWAQATRAATLGDDDATLAELFPASIAIYVDLQPIASWSNHPVRERLLASEDFLKLWRSPEVMKLRGGITLAELALGDSIESVAKKLTVGGWAIAVDRLHEGAILVARAESAEWLEDYVVRLAKLAAGDNAQPARVEETTYRGAKAYKLDKTVVAAVNEYLLVTEKGDLARQIADRILDGSTSNPGLTSTDFYVQAQSLSGTKAGSNTPVAWFAVNLPVLREAGFARELLGGKADDFGGEMFIGGVLGVLHQAPALSGELVLTEQGIALELTTPYDHSWLGEQREHFVGPEGKGAAEPALKAEGTIATLSAYRDLSQLWLWAGDLFDEGVNDQLAQADSTLTTLFSGHDFGTEILAAVYPELQLIVSQQTFDEADFAPTIEIPAIALVGRLRDPDLMRGELKRTFQSLVGLLNITGAMNGQPQFDLNDRDIDGAKVYTAAYVAPIDARFDRPAPIQYNFSPAIAFVEDRVVIASTIPQAEQLVKALQHRDQAVVEPADGQNTALHLNAAAAYAALLANRDQLIAQNILEKGHSRGEAENEIDALLSIVSLFKSAALTLRFAPQMEAHVSLQLK